MPERTQFGSLLSPGQHLEEVLSPTIPLGLNDGEAVLGAADPDEYEPQRDVRDQDEQQQQRCDEEHRSGDCDDRHERPPDRQEAAHHLGGPRRSIDPRPLEPVVEARRLVVEQIGRGGDVEHLARGVPGDELTHQTLTFDPQRGGERQQRSDTDECE